MATRAGVLAFQAEALRGLPENPYGAALGADQALWAGGAPLQPPALLADHRLEPVQQSAADCEYCCPRSTLEEWLQGALASADQGPPLPFVPHAPFWQQVACDLRPCSCLCRQVYLYWRADLAPIVLDVHGLPSLDMLTAQREKDAAEARRAAEEKRRTAAEKRRLAEEQRDAG